MSSGQLLKYPYTLGARIMQFPFKMHYQKNWLFRSMVLGFFLTLPIMAKITMSFPDEKPKKAEH
eukprot:maker-scaffold21_size687808-snap-gene-1.17 protein:Tk09830 transcript:maker-scaffold21_size687808-snap-gene-1.17-mRNA-1 annotation:"hypothetical protein G5I_13062"